MGNLNLLLIDDSEDTCQLVVSAFGTQASVTWSPTLADAKQRLSAHDFHMILLDIHLPDGDGFHFYSELYQGETPVIFLTGRDSVEDKVKGISMGADDYITKPFSTAELRARVGMRIEKESSRSMTLRKGDLMVDFPSQRACVVTGDQRQDLQLTQIEFRLLALFLRNEGQMFSRSQLLNRVWGENISLTDRCVDSHVYSLRRKLGKYAEWIQSQYGEGYFLNSQNS